MAKRKKKKPSLRRRMMPFIFVYTLGAFTNASYTAYMYDPEAEYTRSAEHIAELLAGGIQGKGPPAIPGDKRFTKGKGYTNEFRESMDELFASVIGGDS